MAKNLSDLINKLIEIQKEVQDDGVPLIVRDSMGSLELEIFDVGLETPLEDEPDSYYIVFDAK